MLDCVQRLFMQKLAPALNQMYHFIHLTLPIDANVPNILLAAAYTLGLCNDFPGLEITNELRLVL